MVILAVLTHGVAAARPEATTLALGPTIRVTSSLLGFLLAPLLWMQRQLLDTLATRREHDGAPTPEDLRFIVESVDDARKLEDDEREMIHGIFGMSSRPSAR